MGICQVGLMFIGLLSAAYCPVRLLSSWVTIRSGYCLSGNCSLGLGMFPRLSIRRSSVRSDYCPDIASYSQTLACRIFSFE